MRNVFLSIPILFTSISLSAQSNALNTTGNVGIGTTNPQYALHLLSQGNTGTVSSLFHGQYFGTHITTEASSADYYAFNVLSGANSAGGGGTSRFFVRGDGNIGIGTTSPMTGSNNPGIQLSRGHHSTLILGNPFQDNNGGFIQTTDNRHRIFLGANLYDDINASWTSVNPLKGAAGISIIADQGDWGAQIGFYCSEDGSLKERMSVLGNGNVGIGTTNPQSKLAVNGDIFSKKVKVTLSGWPDYVFHAGYKLPSLKDVEDYIKQNNHLPDIPSANEVEQHGLDLGNNQAALLKKIEELTLYIIEQNKKIEHLEAQHKEWVNIKKELEFIKAKLTN